MKRSEMVEIIKKQMEPWTNGVASYDEQKTTADDLLSKLEEAGMLPPSICYHATGEYDDTKIVKELLSDSYDAGFEWEEE